MTSVFPLSTGAVAGRVVADGPDFHLTGDKWELRGVAYGPFRPNDRGEHFPPDDALARDFAHIRRLGFNTVRVYELPTEAVLREARRQDLRLIAGVPWTDHTDFLSEAEAWAEVKRRIVEAAERFSRSDRVAVLLVGNEIEKTLVRWLGPPRVKRAMEELVSLAQQAAPDCLIGYATYPSTEYILPDNADVVAVNVYLEERGTFERYMRRLINHANGRPMLLSEFGLDAGAGGEQRQAETYQWMLSASRELGVAGTVWFSYTDEWFRGGEAVTGWSFGLVDQHRAERPVCALLNPPQCKDVVGPLLSVIVCTRNGGSTLGDCLSSLQRQQRVNYEVLVIDDGSTDDVPQIAARHASVRYHRQEHAGLSAARNLGMQLAAGELLVYTDDDCRPDEDWLWRIAAAFDDPQWVAAGGPNLPPAPRSEVERCVSAAPGGPCHVLLSDEEAEHLPGCNLAIRKTALEEIGGFDPVFRAAGDDVDVCWRLRETGGKLRFVPGAFVWHHRRLTLGAYLRQQRGYGFAEALLMKKHPYRFGSLGGARWRGMIYGDGAGALPPTEGSIFHGPYGTGAFQVIYATGHFGWWHWFAGVLWIALAVMLLLVGFAAGAVMLTALASYFAARSAARQWKRSRMSGGVQALRLWALCLLQPVVREWARLRGMISTGARPTFKTTLPDILPPMMPKKRTLRLAVLNFWSATGKGRDEWLYALREQLSKRARSVREDDGWRWFDLESSPLAWLTVTEFHGGPRMLTRVAVLSRMGWRSLLLPMALMVVGIFSAGPLLYWLGAAVGVLCIMLWWQRRQGIRLAREAADQAGLQAMRSGE
jgi:O-antigen biosynthesis protein